ncbi:Gfo/Idh/MocA family protein [uncultured Ruthenibacterium sp.]|uniref:Gfo/Idh/MocA family protein n=1 Tax=uncultured Ruthenibacterium sp. TaxID=1905347 RepID=UPI00349EB283
MKVLFVGLGSIGTRHLKNLNTIAQEKGLQVESWALRSSDRPLPEDVRSLLAGEVRTLKEEDRFDAAFITNPTSLHFSTLGMLRGKVESLFIEKPIFDRTDVTLSECIAPGQKAYVAAPMRWCGVMLALKRRLASLKPYSARVICSSYLPDWRPGVDYRTVYSAHRDMGGGVTIDLIHEWDYLVELFGKPLEMYNFKGTYSDLEIDSDDLSVYIARYPSMLVEVHLDYFGREYRRSLELFCKDGTVTADFGKGTLTLADGTVEHWDEPVNQRYLREMDYFLDYAQSGIGESVNTPDTALDVLKLTLGEI